MQEFGVGFPPRIGSVVWHGTRYSVNWIPLGGFVKMLGEDGDVEADKMRKRGLSEAAVDKAMEGAFNRKPIWVRIVVLVAGVAMNFLLAAVLFAVALSLPGSEGRGPLTITEIQAGSPAVTAGLQVGDVIVAADGRTFDVSRDLTAYVRSRAGHLVELTVRRAGERDGDRRHAAHADRRRGGEGPRRGRIQLRAGSIRRGPAQRRQSGRGGLGRGSPPPATWPIKIPGGLASAVAGLLGLAPDAGTAVGPIGIASETGRVLRAPLVSQLIFVGILSVNLAVLNVLPFPPLDGGRIAVVVVEAVRRRRLPAEREALVYLTGFMVLIVLVILISIRDVANLIGG